VGQICGNSSSHYTANGAYHANIQRLAATLPTNASSSTKLFATPTIGEVPDTVYALALCRGDADSSCLVRYSDQNFLSIPFSSRRIRRRAPPPPPTSLSQRRPFATRARPGGDDDASVPLSSGCWASTAC